MKVHDGDMILPLEPYGVLAGRRITSVTLEAEDIRKLLTHNHNNELVLWLSDLLLRFPPKHEKRITNDRITLGLDLGDADQTILTRWSQNHADTVLVDMGVRGMKGDVIVVDDIDGEHY